MIFNLDEFLKQSKPYCEDPYTDIVIYRAKDIYKAFLFNNDLTDDDEAYVYEMFERRMRQERPTGVAFIDSEEEQDG